jgi:uncharacterized protein YcaQ
VNAVPLTWDQVRAWRVRRHHLDERVPARSAMAVVSRLCGLHAQVLSSAELTLWARVEGLKRTMVRDALWKKRTLVKLWAMRGTLHLLPAAEYPMWQAALSTYDHYRRGAWLKAFGVPAGELDRLVEAIGEALEKEPLTREELAAAVGKRIHRALGEKLLQSWGSVLKPASYEGKLCFGPSEGQRVRFTNPTVWLGPHDEVDPHEARLDVIRRYLGAYGPASRADLARWWALTPAPAGRLLQELGDEIAEVTVEGAPAWMLAEHVGEARAAKPTGSVRLLPGFDQYVVGATRGAAALFPGDHAPRVYRPQGWLSPVLLVDGRMDGVWRHERKGRRLTVAIEPFVKPTAKVRRGAEAEAERLADFLGGDLALAWV